MSYIEWLFWFFWNRFQANASESFSFLQIIRVENNNSLATNGWVYLDKRKTWMALKSNKSKYRLIINHVEFTHPKTATKTKTTKNSLQFDVIEAQQSGKMTQFNARKFIHHQSIAKWWLVLNGIYTSVRYFDTGIKIKFDLDSTMNRLATLTHRTFAFISKLNVGCL